jgi:hypothetical protein
VHSLGRRADQTDDSRVFLAARGMRLKQLDALPDLPIAPSVATMCT